MDIAERTVTGQKYFISVESVVACSRQLVNKTKRDSNLRHGTPVPAEEKMRDFFGGVTSRKECDPQAT